MADAPVEPERVLPVRLKVTLAAGNVHLRVCQLQHNSSLYCMFSDNRKSLQRDSINTILYCVFVRTFVVSFCYGSGSGSNFLTSYGSGSTRQKVTVPTVPVPVPQHWYKDDLSYVGLLDSLWFLTLRCPCRLPGFIVLPHRSQVTFSSV